MKVPRELQLPTTTLSDTLGTLRNCTALAELGCRAQLIQKLTSAGMPTIRSILERVGGVVNDKGGRQPRSLATILESSDRHVSASRFMNYYVALLGYHDGGRGYVHTDAFVRALYFMQSRLQSDDAAQGDGNNFTADHAYMVADMYHRSELHVKQCPVCTARFIQSATHLTIRQHITQGECPLCRVLASITRGRAVVKIADPRSQRALLNNLTSS